MSLRLTSVGDAQSQGLLVLRVAEAGEFRLESGREFGPVDIAYRTWGTYRPEADGGRGNAVLVCHALTGDTDAPGWWSGVVGGSASQAASGSATPALDPERHFIIASNVLGGCAGSTGPGSLDPGSLAPGSGEPQRGRPYGLRFPQVTVGDMVRAQSLLLDRLGVERLALVTGGSLGGMQALAWALLFPERVARAVVLGAPWATSPMSIAWNEIGRQAILADPDFRNGDYYDAGDEASRRSERGAVRGGMPVRSEAHKQGRSRPNGPARGLAIARMLAMTSYRSERSFWLRQGRHAIGGDGSGASDFRGTATRAEEASDQRSVPTDPVRERLGAYATELSPDHPFAPHFRMESYLHLQGERLARRFDANSYLYLTRAMDLFDAGRYTSEAGRAPRAAARPVVTTVGLSTDVLYLPGDVRDAAACLRVFGYDARYREIASPHGHDAFLIEASAVSSVLAEALAE